MKNNKELSRGEQKKFRSPLHYTLKEGSGRINAPHGTEL